jgi:hypothetical protein
VDAERKQLEAQLRTQKQKLGALSPDEKNLSAMIDNSRYSPAQRLALVNLILASRGERTEYDKEQIALIKQKGVTNAVVIALINCEESASAERFKPT